MKNIISLFSGNEWTFVEDSFFVVYESRYKCFDGNPAILWFDKEHTCFDLRCFNDNSMNYITIIEKDFENVWQNIVNSGNEEFYNADFVTQTISIADYFCSIFCKSEY